MLRDGRSMMIQKERTARARRSGADAYQPTHLTRTHLDTIVAGVGSDRTVAHLLQVSPSQVSRWRTGQVPDIDNADRLAGLALVVEMLLRWLEREAIAGWLEGANAHLGDRTPAFLLRRGQVADVIGALEAEKAGVYA
jgi:transcriptional regulator with XRE-family HTH domain